MFLPLAAKYSSQLCVKSIYMRIILINTTGTDEKALIILKSVREAMGPHSRTLVRECIETVN